MLGAPRQALPQNVHAGGAWGGGDAADHLGALETHHSGPELTPPQQTALLKDKPAPPRVQATKHDEVKAEEVKAEEPLGPSAEALEEATFNALKMRKSKKQKDAALKKPAAAVTVKGVKKAKLEPKEESQSGTDDDDDDDDDSDDESLDMDAGKKDALKRPASAPSLGAPAQKKARGKMPFPHPPIFTKKEAKMSVSRHVFTSKYYHQTLKAAKSAGKPEPVAKEIARESYKAASDFHKKHTVS